MLRNFFKIALRYLWRKKTYSVLNFLCLTFGMACSIITILYIQNVFSYDKFHKNYNRLYSVDAYVTFFNGDRFPKEYLSASLAETLKVQAPEIDEIISCTENESEFINGDRKFSVKGVYADTNFFRVFTFPLDGAVSYNVLSDQNSVIISESIAGKFFLNTDCVGKTLIMKKAKGNEAFKIAGVFHDVPQQSTMHFDYVIPFSKFLADNKWATETGATSNSNWILLKKNIDYRIVENKIRNLIKDQESTLNQELFKTSSAVTPLKRI
jgi:putative ABC transport system permease protein